jgi:hypothetical protein
MDRHLRGYWRHAGPLGDPADPGNLQQTIADRLEQVLDMMVSTGASVPAERGLTAGGLVRLTVAR